MNLVVTGTVGAGKTTFILSVSEIEMDFGTLQFGDEMALHIYGIPGQTRFDFIGLTHSDCAGAWSSEDIALALGLSRDHPTTTHRPRRCQ
jgi:uncharacterized protein